MKRIVVVAAVLLLLTPQLSAAASKKACWGQATQVFAQLEGGLGDHSSSQSNPRAGLRNLARELADMGVIPDDSMQSLGAFVLGVLGISIDECQ